MSFNGLTKEELRSELWKIAFLIVIAQTALTFGLLTLLLP